MRVAGDLFRESVEYLQELGALEGKEELHVLMPNYMLGPSNCDGTTSFYDLCCPNACEVHKAHLERAMGGTDQGDQDHAGIITRVLRNERLGVISPEMLQWLEQLAKDGWHMALQREVLNRSGTGSHGTRECSRSRMVRCKNHL